MIQCGWKTCPERKEEVVMAVVAGGPVGLRVRRVPVVSSVEVGEV